MFTIAKQFSFDAAHFIAGLPEGHKCGRMHGHTYTVEVILQSEALDTVGFVRDYGELSVVKDWIDNTVDHRNLNEVLGHDQTTAENIAKHIFELFYDLPELIAVRVSETPKTWAEYRP